MFYWNIAVFILQPLVRHLLLSHLSHRSPRIAKNAKVNPTICRVHAGQQATAWPFISFIFGCSAHNGPAVISTQTWTLEFLAIYICWVVLANDRYAPMFA